MALAKLNADLERALAKLGHTSDDSPRDAVSARPRACWNDGGGGGNTTVATSRPEEVRGAFLAEARAADARAWDLFSRSGALTMTPPPSLPSLRRGDSAQEALDWQALPGAVAFKGPDSVAGSTEANDQAESTVLESSISSLDSTRCSIWSPFQEGSESPSRTSSAHCAEEVPPLLRGALVAAGQPMHLGGALRGALRPSRGSLESVDEVWDLHTDPRLQEVLWEVEPAFAERPRRPGRGEPGGALADVVSLDPLDDRDACLADAPLGGGGWL